RFDNLRLTKSGRRGPNRKACPPPARHRPGARSARRGDVPPFYRRPTWKGELTMSLHRWLRNLRSALPPRRGQRKYPRPRAQRAPTHRPGLEVLEDRTVPAFLAPVDYAVLAAFAVDAEAGDFNGDTVLDLATVGQDGVVNVLLGNPDGTFQPA